MMWHERRMISGFRLAAVALLSAALMLSVWLPCAALAERPPVAVDFSKNHVDINSAFSGEYLILFGVQNSPGDLVITVEGPTRDMVVRRKDKTLGMWMNHDEKKFENVPSYYNVAVSRPDIDIGAYGLDAESMLGSRPSAGSAESSAAPPLAEDKIFRQALVRNKIKQNLFAGTAEPVTYIDEGFFRTRFYIPANVSTGDFLITTYLIHDKKSKETGKTRVSVRQIGTADAVLRFSREHAALYGLLSVLFAVGIGWLSNHIRGRLR